MKNLFFVALSILALLVAGYTFINISGKLGFGIVFICGFLFGIFLMNIKLNMKNDKLSSYKRELEKESIASDEHSSRVKVLESKIEVLEKALENALEGKGK